MPECIHPKLIKVTKSALKKYNRLNYFYKVFGGRKHPNNLEKANVTAIFIKGGKCKAEIYRPISLTSVTGKLIERLVRNAIVEHMTTNNLFSESQHGFFKRKILCNTIARILRGHNSNVQQNIEQLQTPQ